MRDCVGGVGARVKLAAGDVGAIVAAIDGPDDDLRDEAIRLAGERKEPAAVPALVRRLKSDDHAVRDRAIGALAAIGDPRAVRPLTEVAKFNELADLPKVLDALATIGGDEARCLPRVRRQRPRQPRDARSRQAGAFAPRSATSGQGSRSVPLRAGRRRQRALTSSQKPTPGGPSSV